MINNDISLTFSGIIITDINSKIAIISILIEIDY